MRPLPKKFTRDNPCTKLDIWNCFRGPRRFIAVQVDQAKSLIGENAPRYLLLNDYMEVLSTPTVESYQLTSRGKEWLMRGMAGFLKNHPDKLGEAKHLPPLLRKR